MYSIGIELSPKMFCGAVVKLGDKPDVIARASIEKSADKIACLTELCNKLVAEANLSVADIEYVGIAAGDKLVGTKCSGCGTDFTELTKTFGVKAVYACRKANAKAIAEEAITYGRGYSFAYIDLNSTIGFGLLIDGKPYVGGNGLASNIAHTTVMRGGKECACGNRGCFEAYCNLEAFETCDYNEYVSYLACGVTNVMNLFQPNVMIVGGEVADRVGEKLLADIGEIVRNENYARNSVNKTLVALPAVKEDAVILGAALLGA